MTKTLDDLRRQAKTLQKTYEAGDRAAIARVDLIKPRTGVLKRADFLHVVAQENNFASWPELKAAVETHGMDRAARQQRLKIALYHGQGHVVQRLMTDMPDLADGAFGLQVGLFDLDAVRSVLADDPAAATRQIGPRRPILHLAFSKVLQIWPERQADMLAIAALLVEHGADVNDGYPAEPGSTHLLSALYGAIGHAGNMALGQWLLDQGADPNDDESLYHATELGHADGVRMLLAAGASPARTNALKRAMDFHNAEMVDLLLDAGAGPNEDHGMTALHHAMVRRVPPAMVQRLLDAGADETIRRQGVTAYSMARVYGVGAELTDMLTPQPLGEAEHLLAQAAEGVTPACTFIDPATIPEIYRHLLHDILHKDDDLAHTKALVAIGIPWDAPNGAGLTPVQIAGWEGLVPVLAYFLSLKPDLSHVNGFGGTLLSTIIHGSENNPNRSGRDYLGCLRLVLAEGVALPRRAIELAGAPEVADLLAAWAAAHPGQVVEHGIA
ncbi:hypothetical protein [Yoonia sp. SS1-5]|uniref:Ankyrin repeat domain-containing protein n=1 Tax=Yoonia rhodophyticola TaxID=3137370 RepID=A0AAN0MFZ5_9RHOB